MVMQLSLTWKKKENQSSESHFPKLILRSNVEMFA